MRTWRNRRRAGPRSRWAQAHEGAIPSVRTNLSRRGRNVDTADSKPAGRNCPCRCKSGRRDQFCGRAWNSRPGGLKNRRASRRVGVQVAPAAPIISASGGMHTRESQKLVGESPCRCESCLADQFIASSSNEHRRPASQAGNAGARPVEATSSAAWFQENRPSYKRSRAGSAPGPGASPGAATIARQA